MTGLVLADAAVIAGGFADSLWQFLGSPWVIAPLAVALAMLAALWRLRRASRRMPLQPLPPALPAAPPCPCCTARPFRVNDCTCREDCGVHWCQAADVGDDLDVPDWVNEGGGRG